MASCGIINQLGASALHPIRKHRLLLLGIDIGEQDSIPGVEVLRDDGFRHKHIRVKGLPTEVLALWMSWT